MNISVNNFQEQKNNVMPGFARPDALSQNGAGKSGNIFAGNLKLGYDPKDEVLAKARKQAYKVVSDAFEADRNVDKQLQEIKDFSRVQQEKKTVAAKDKAAAEEMIQNLKDEYQVDPEYQSRMLEANSQLDAAKTRMDEADKAMMAARQTLTDAETEKNKTHAMADAQDESETIMAEAEKAVIGMAMNEAKEHIEEKAQEEQEKVQEKKEEKEEQEEIEAEREEKKAIQEALVEGTKESVQEAREDSRKRKADDIDLTDVIGTDPVHRLENAGDVQAALNEIKNKMALVDADLKGIKVDEIL